MKSENDNSGEVNKNPKDDSGNKISRSLPKENNYWSGTEGVFYCLLDSPRTEAFKSAIENIVKEGDVVADMGAGTGVLSMIAARAGASKVYAIEADNVIAKNLRKTIISNNFQEVVEVLEGDASSISLPQKVDVVIGEMIASGLVEEIQVQANNNIINFGKNDVKVILNKIELFAELVHSKNNYYGFNFFSIKYDFPCGCSRDLNVEAFSEKVMYRDVDFSSFIDNEKVNVEVDLKILKTGEINGIKITSRTLFCDGSSFEYSNSYAFPLILPIDEISVEKGEIKKLNIRYDLCGGFGKLKYYFK